MSQNHIEHIAKLISMKVLWDPLRCIEMKKIENWPDFKDKLGNWANAFSLKIVIRMEHLKQIKIFLNQELKVAPQEEES